MLVESTSGRSSSALALRIMSANGPSPSVEPLTAPVNTGTLAITIVGCAAPTAVSTISEAPRRPVV